MEGTPIPANDGQNIGVTADFNHDGVLDIAITTAGSGVCVFFGQGNAQYGPPNCVGASAPGWVGTGDMNGDGVPDIIFGDPNAIQVILSLGDGNFAAPQTQSLSCYPGQIVTADLNGDGWPDVVVGGGSCGSLSVFFNLGHGDGAIGPEHIVNGASGADFQYVAVADINGDGHPDLVTADGNSSVVVFLNNNNGGFGSPVVTNELSGALFLAALPPAGDQSQIAVTLSSSRIAIMDGQASGMVTQVASSAVDSVYGTILADLSGTGSPDVLSWNNAQITLSANLGNGSFAPGVDIPVSSGPDQQQDIQWLAPGDLNNDGAEDVVVLFGAGSIAPYMVPYLNNCP